MPTITRPRKPSNKAKAKTPSKVKLPTRDPLDRTMARASALVWPNAAQPTSFCDRASLQYPTFKKKMASVVTKMTRAFRTYWKDLAVDSLPYSDELDAFMKKNWPTLRPAYYNAVCLTLYLTALRLRKTGELAHPKAKSKPKVKAKVKVKASRKRPAKAKTPKAPTSTAPLTLVA